MLIASANSSVGRRDRAGESDAIACRDQKELDQRACLFRRRGRAASNASERESAASEYTASTLRVHESLSCHVMSCHEWMRCVHV